MFEDGPVLVHVVDVAFDHTSGALRDRGGERKGERKVKGRVRGRVVRGGEREREREG